MGNLAPKEISGNMSVKVYNHPGLKEEHKPLRSSREERALLSYMQKVLQEKERRLFTQHNIPVYFKRHILRQIRAHPNDKTLRPALCSLIYAVHLHNCSSIDNSNGHILILAERWFERCVKDVVCVHLEELLMSSSINYCLEITPPPQRLIPISHLGPGQPNDSYGGRRAGCGTAHPRPMGHQSDDSQWVSLYQHHKTPFVERVELQD